MLLIFIMKILKNLFGSKTKLATSDIATVAGIPLDDLTIVESGTNANGSWVKFGNGMMICRHRADFGPVNTSANTLFRSGNLSWTFPQAFVDSQVYTHGTVQYGWESVWVASSSESSSVTQYKFRLISLSSASSLNIAVNLLAIGRWK